MIEENLIKITAVLLTFKVKSPVICVSPHCVLTQSRTCSKVEKQVYNAPDLYICRKLTGRYCTGLSFVVLFRKTLIQPGGTVISNKF